MKRMLSIIVLGALGLVVALSLTVGALALAGNDVGSVVHPDLSGSSRPTASATPAHGDDRSDEASATPKASTPSDEATVAPSEDSGSHGSGESNSSSADDSSGSGSDDPGGSGAEDSGSGTGGDDHSDDDD